MEALIVIFATGLLSLFIAMAKKPILVLLTSVVGLSSGLGLMIAQWYNPFELVGYSGLQFDPQAILYSILAIVFTLLIVVAGYAYFSRDKEHTGEYIGLLTFSLCGALCMVSFTDMFMFFIGLEILSIPIYVMAGTRKKNLDSTEAALKYFFTGSFATGILLFGIAWVYGATGSFDLAVIADSVASGEAQGPLLYVGVLMIMASFLFKVGAAPFHFWSPDVYGGSPNIVTGFMAAVVKLAGLYAFLKIFQLVFGELHHFWSGALFGLIILTMFVGNLTALRQSRFKRLLAYSSISNAGYALLTVMVQDVTSFTNLWMYIFGYGFSVITLIVISLILNDESDEIANYRGIGRKNPFLGFMLIIGLLSLAGVPPLAGFFGKYMVFASAFEQYPLLVILAVVNSGIGMYYYLKLLITAMSKEDAEDAAELHPSMLQYVVLGFCAVGLIAGGLFAV
ncbi:MAG: NADH-quinone oxidoreductase subunit N [Bacteroidota bacterium]|jgi:NADH-quinone oxidoreductase subunit N